MNIYVESKTKKPTQLLGNITEEISHDLLFGGNIFGYYINGMMSEKIRC